MRLKLQQLGKTGPSKKETIQRCTDESEHLLPRSSNGNTSELLLYGNWVRDGEGGGEEEGGRRREEWENCHCYSSTPLLCYVVEKWRRLYGIFSPKASVDGI